jgi:lambda family phage portal protein
MKRRGLVSRFVSAFKMAWYKTADVNPGNANFSIQRRNMVTTLNMEGPRLAARARDLFANTALGRGVVRAMIRHAVPQPIHPIPAAKNTKGEANKEYENFNDVMGDLWARWTRDPLAFSVDGLMRYSQMQRCILRECIVNGEVFLVAQNRRNANGLPGLRIEIVSSQRLASVAASQPYTSVRADDRAGIERDKDGRPVAYHFTERTDSGQTIRFEARDVLHLMLPLYPGQQFGEAISAPIGELLHHISAYLLAEVQGQQAAASIAIITKGQSDILPADNVDSTGTALEPGLYALESWNRLHLAPGEEVTQVPAMRPGGQFPSFMGITQKNVASGAGVPHEEISGDYAGVNLSTARISAMVAEENGREWRELVELAATWMYDRFVDAAILEGMRVPQGATLAGIRMHTHTVPAARIMDPSKEITAFKEAMQSGMMNWTDVLQRFGSNPKRFLDIKKAEMELIKQSGVAIDPYGELDNGASSDGAAVVPARSQDNQDDPQEETA